MLLFLGMSALFTGCKTSKITSSETDLPTYYSTSKPCTRWWWFATEIKKVDIKHQLDWAKANNFGGVEIAWVYPLYRYARMYERDFGQHFEKDSSAQKWLSKEWSEMATYTKRYADSIGLVCDFTFGSAWPVAGPDIEKKHRTQIYGDSTFQQLLTFSWSYPDTMYVIDHLNADAFEAFAGPITEALEDALKGSKSAFFTDSWEIKLNSTNKIWTNGFDSTFKESFGYDIIPYMEKGIDSFPDVRYDYMLHLDHYVTNGFYRPYVQKCKDAGAWSRVQCLASPTDVLTTYSLVDIPETESMLNNPNYSRIVSSAGALSKKRLISSETFTCMYGFANTYIRQEQTADLKMVADAMFAEGVNQHFYHGMPYNPKGSDSISFFATTYFGPRGSLTDELPAFNDYVGRVSGLLQQGKTYSNVAIYIPYEDGVMKGAYPPERQRVWVWGEYEMRYINPPAELEGYHPLWINRHFLEQAQWIDGRLEIGDASFSTLYINVKHMDSRALSRVLELAKEGLPVCLKTDTREPGKIKCGNYAEMLQELKKLPNVKSEFHSITNHLPLIQGDSIPAYWARKLADGSTLLFIAQPKSKGLMYPIYSGQSAMDTSIFRDVTISTNGFSQDLKLEFKPYQSIMLKISSQGKIEFIDIGFVPKKPVIREREKQRMHF